MVQKTSSWSRILFMTTDSLTPNTIYYYINAVKQQKWVPNVKHHLCKTALNNFWHGFLIHSLRINKNKKHGHFNDLFIFTCQWLKSPYYLGKKNQEIQKYSLRNNFRSHRFIKITVYMTYTKCDDHMKPVVCKKKLHSKTPQKYRRAPFVLSAFWA